MAADGGSHMGEFDKSLSRIATLSDLIAVVEKSPTELDDSNQMKKVLTAFDKILLTRSDHSCENDGESCESLVQWLKRKYDCADTAQKHISNAVQLIYHFLRRHRPIGLRRCIRELVPSLYTNRLDKVARANAIVCLQLYVQQFNDKELLQQLWQTIATEHNISETSIQILVHLIDDFMRLIEGFRGDPVFTRIITESLLNSQLPAERKAGYYLLRKYVTGEAQCSRNDAGPSHAQWMSYISVLEALEENQSHLILPTLQLMKSLPLTGGTFWMNLLDILYKKVLAHSNSRIIEWAVEYFLGNFTCSYIESLCLLPALLGCLNNTRLYNYEGHFLSVESASLFLRDDLKGFIEEMSHINWKSVPLHFWLKQLVNVHARVPLLSTDTVLGLASRIRNLQHVSLRNLTRRHFSHAFRATIKQLPFNEYCMLIEALHNVNDTFPDIEQFVQKASESPVVDRSALTGRLFQIVSNKFCANEERGTERVWNVEEKARWLHEFKLFSRMSFLAHLYGMNVQVLNEQATLSDVVAVFRDAFDALGIDCGAFVKEKALEYYVRWFWHQHNGDVQLNELIDMASPAAFWETLQKFPDGIECTPAFVTKCLQHLRTILEKHKHDAHVYDILDLLFRVCDLLPQQKQLAYQKKLFDISMTVPMYTLFRYWEKPKNFTINSYDGLIFGEMTTGDCRIEKIYNMHANQLWCPQYQVRFYNMEYCDVFGFAQQLLDLNNGISKQKPRYFENSKEHLLKMRIARAILRAVIIREFWSPDMWLPILEQNNQLNVTYVYEICIAYLSTNIKSIMEKVQEIGNYTPSVQISLISILHCYCTVHGSKVMRKHRKAILNILLPLTMGANFQVRLFTQLTLYKMLSVETIDDSVETTFVRTALEKSVGKERLHQLIRNDVRLQIHKLCIAEEFLLPDVIAYVSNAPIDEYEWIDPSLTRFEDLRKSFMNRHSLLKEYGDKAMTKTAAPPQMQDATNVQRKINPTKELLTQSNLISYPECDVHNEMFVVASLIDKLPNLGGIARTCEVFGIKNLVLSSKAHTQRDEFKNLSMSAENMLNIIEVKSSGLIEFLMQKRLEGYKIVGAEQTANSKSFVDFQFPKKCVLLMGHEKEGLPPNLIGLLDDAIEIPQFGMVRSLNVHVTGALFMWEYCKQHIVNVHK